RKRARGWPAVIALAAHARLADVDLTEDSLSEQLYDYLAEELFDCAGEDVRAWLASLALLPALTPADLSEFLCASDASQLVLATGLAYQANGRVEVHPLAKHFLLSKLRERGDASDVANRAFDLALGKRLYDVAFDVARDGALPEQLERL